MQKRDNERRTLGETIQIVISVIIIALAIFTFLSPERNRRVFPAIFTLASTLSFMNMGRMMEIEKKDKETIIRLVIYGVLGVLLVILSVIVAISL